MIPGTTTTVAAAIGPGEFVVALGVAASASVENFDEVIGRNRAISKAEVKARAKLWELEGWRLKRNLLDLSEAGLLASTLDPELIAAVGSEWPSAAVPAAVMTAFGIPLKSCPCGGCGPESAQLLALSASGAPS